MPPEPVATMNMAPDGTYVIKLPSDVLFEQGDAAELSW